MRPLICSCSLAATLLIPTFLGGSGWAFQVVVHPTSFRASSPPPPSRVKGSASTRTLLQRSCESSSSSSPLSKLCMAASNDEDDADASTPRAKWVSAKSGGSVNKKKTKKKAKRKAKKSFDRPMSPEEQETELLMKELKSRIQKPKDGDEAADSKSGKKDGKGSILEKLDPFKAGQNLRKTIGSLTALGAAGAALSSEARQKYYLDDRLNGGLLFSERNPNVERIEKDDYVPEVLVIGATGEVGRLVVRRLLLEGRFRIRVLVRDLYSKTLNLLGTGVTYCQGDLSNMESLEYALTDVDKIIFCASAPRPDEDDFKEKFKYFVRENLQTEQGSVEKAAKDENSEDDRDWEKLDSVLELRAQLAEQIDFVGMGNLVRAYQNVRHADYGTSQAAKRSLFKFHSRPEDFDLFTIDDYDPMVSDVSTRSGKDMSSSTASKVSSPKMAMSSGGGSNDSYDNYDDEFPDEDPYANYYGDDYDDYGSSIEQRRDASVQAQCKWIRNELGNAVFVGKVPKASQSGVGGEASIISSRLRSREEPETGIDLSTGFAGFVVRLLGDGNLYEAFVRTEAYERDGIEYVCEFSTSTKPFKTNNKSRNKFTTVRLPFENFKPVQRKPNFTGGSNDNEVDDEETEIDRFNGNDVRNIGFRYRSARNQDLYSRRNENGDYNSFYLALSYMKVYRSQPEPEFIYLSDARIPRKIPNGMVRHDLRRLLTNVDESGIDGDTVQLLLDEKELQTAVDSKLSRSKEETYFKYRGEETLKNSGLSYTVIRVSGFNEDPGGEASTIELYPTNEEEIMPVSRDEAAQVCIAALLDPNALNKSIYMTKNQRRIKGGIPNEDISSKFSNLPVDVL